MGEAKTGSVLPLNFNESQFGTSPAALEALRGELGRLNCYPEFFNVDLRRALGERFGFGDEGLKHVVVDAGASSILSLVGRTFLSPGDELLTCAPTYDAYRMFVAEAGATAVEAPLTEDQCYDLDAMRERISDRTRIVYLCNPNNPTGTVVPHDELARFVRELPQDVIVMADEAYIDFADDPDSLTLLPELHDGLPIIIIRTFSKLYGMAGLRVGYAVTTEEIVDRMLAYARSIAVTRPSQAAALAALGDTAFVEYVRAGVAGSRRFLTQELTKLGWKVYPSQANFIYADSHLDTAKLAEALAQHGALIRGNYEFSRISVGTLEQDRALIKAIRAVLDEGSVPAR